MNRKIALLFLALMVFGVFSISGCGLFGGKEQSSPEKLIEAFMEALNKNDVEKLAQFTGEEAEALNFFEGEDFFSSYEVVNVEEVSDSKGSATVKVEHEKDGTAFFVDYVFEITKSDGKWFVTDMGFNLDDWENIIKLPVDEVPDEEQEDVSDEDDESDGEEPETMEEE